MLNILSLWFELEQCQGYSVTAVLSSANYNSGSYMPHTSTKGEYLQEFSELIPVVSNCKSNDPIHPLKINVCAEMI